MRLASTALIAADLELVLIVCDRALLVLAVQQTSTHLSSVSDAPCSIKRSRGGDPLGLARFYLECADPSDLENCSMPQKSLGR